MPAEFLTDAQRRRYGRFCGELPVEALGQYFHFDERDRALIGMRRGAHNRMGFAIQLGTVRCLGTFLDDPTDVPSEIISHVKQELGLAEAVDVARYRRRYATYAGHAREIRRHYGYRELCEPSAALFFLRWIYTKAWLAPTRPSALFDAAAMKLLRHKILLPGITTLSRLVSRVRSRTAERLWTVLAAVPTAKQKKKLGALLQVSEGDQRSGLDRLRRGPTRVSAPALVDALQRVDDFRALGLGAADLSAIPSRRITELARYAAVASAQTVGRMSDERRNATLVAFAHVYQARAVDDALEVLDLLLDDIRKEAENIGKMARLRSIGDLDAAALRLLEVCQVVLDSECPNGRVRKQALATVPSEQLEQAAATVRELAREPAHGYKKELVERHRRVRLFLPALLRGIKFEGISAAKGLLKGLRFLSRLEGESRPDMANAPMDFVPGSWLALVRSGDTVNRRAYTLCALECLQEALRRRDVFVADAERWADPRIKLLHGQQWRGLKPKLCRAVGRKHKAEDELAALRLQLDEAYRNTAKRLASNEDVRIETQDGKDKLVVTNLDKVDEPASLVALRDTIQSMLPTVQLPELLLEIHARTGFANHFHHVSEAESSVEDLHISVCAVLLADACNVGMEPFTRDDVPALTRSRLAWVRRNYVRPDTLRAANAVLVKAQTEIPLAQKWGCGDVASADGLRFVVPVRAINARPNAKYFKNKRGLTWYELMSDQFAGLNGVVVPGTLRDSMYILEVLLGQQTCVRPTEIMTDTAGASDVVFALFWLLGYRFSPRLADVGASTFWRMDAKADYGAMNPLSKRKINTKLIVNNWEDILRVMGSLHHGTVTASELIRTLLRGTRPSELTRAIRELGRIVRTIFQLQYIDDEDYRRRVLTQLNRGEARWSLARAIFFGRKGELRQRYQEGQEDQLGALGLVVNAAVLWQTLYMNEALTVLQRQGMTFNEDDLPGLSPLIRSNLSVLGKYSFYLSEALQRGEMRPLRTPTPLI